MGKKQQSRGVGVYEQGCFYVKWSEKKSRDNVKSRQGPEEVREGESREATWMTLSRQWV